MGGAAEGGAQQQQSTSIARKVLEEQDYAPMLTTAQKVKEGTKTKARNVYEVKVDENGKETKEIVATKGTEVISFPGRNLKTNLKDCTGWVIKYPLKDTSGSSDILSYDGSGERVKLIRNGDARIPWLRFDWDATKSHGGLTLGEEEE